MATRTTVALPGGLIDDAGVLHRQVVVRGLCGRDEEWLHQLPPQTTQARAVTEILLRTVRSIGPHRATRTLVLALPAGDRDYLALKVRQLTFGSRIELVLACPACGGKMDVEFDLDTVPVAERPQQPAYGLRVEGGPDLTFRLPRGADLEAAPDAAALLARCVDGGPPPASARTAVDEAMERVSATVPAEFEAACPECGHSFSAPFDPATLLLGDLDRRRPQFDRAVHLLSWHYHWRLGEILALTPARREHYVDLLFSQVTGVS